MKPRRMGHFTITSAVLEEEKLARAVYRDLIVYKVDHNVATGIVDIWAVHPDFVVVPEERPVTEYIARIEQTPQGEYTVVWKS